MFEVVCTGTNKNYGQRGHKKLLGDSYLIYAVKRGWIEDSVKYAGSGQSVLQQIESSEVLMPVKKVDALRVLSLQDARIQRLIGLVTQMVETNAKLQQLLEGDGKREK